MLRKIAIVLFLLFTVSTASSLAQSRRQVISPAGHPLGLPFSPAVFSGDFLYVSGTLGNLSGKVEVTGNVASQTRRTLENIGSILRHAGLDFSHVVSSDVYLADMRDFAAMNEVYRNFFRASPPARATVEAGMMVREALVEITVIASRNGQSEIVRPMSWPVPSSPYSYGVKSGQTLFVAGMISEDAGAARVLEGDAGRQSRRALQNLGEVLRTAGMNYSDVTGCLVYLADARDFQAMNGVFREFFEEQPPVRATVQARLALPELRVEMKCMASSDPERKVIGVAAPNRPFSPAIQAGDKVYVAGMVGRGTDGFAPGDVRAQTRQALVNVRTALEAGGLDLSDIVAVTVFVTDTRFYSDMNQVYREMMPSTPPARATVAMGLMSPDALVEIMVTAVQR